MVGKKTQHQNPRKKVQRFYVFSVAFSLEKLQKNEFFKTLVLPRERRHF